MKFIKRNGGQILIELLVSLLVGGFLFVSATFAVVSFLRYNFESRITQSTALHASEAVNFLEQIALNDWQKISTLTKGTSTPHFIISGATSSLIIEGKESIVVDDIKSGLVGYWKFDEATSSIAYDSSGNWNTGIPTGGPTKATSSCMIGSCYSFDGNDDYINMGSGASLNTPTDYTIGMWAYNKAGSDTYPTLFNRAGQSGSNGFFWVYTGGTDEVNVSFQWSTGSGYISTTFNNVFPKDAWTHLTFVFTNSDKALKLYANGSQFSTTRTLTNSLPVDDGALYVGTYQGTATNYSFDGSIDDVRIYNRALSVSEIKQLYESKINERYVYVENVYRDGNGNITSTGGTLDPSSYKITSSAETEEGKVIAYEEYLTRNNSLTFSQKDWSGGPGIEGPVTSTPTGFSTSSNIVSGTDIALATTSSSGWLESSTYDTRVINGGALHSIFWNGNYPQNTLVRFQLAPATSSSGPWNYVGPDGTGVSYFSPSTTDNQVEIMNINNYRYFRYKVFISPLSTTSTPIVEDIHINFSL